MSNVNEKLTGVYYEPISKLVPKVVDIAAHQHLVHLQINLLDLSLSQRILRNLGFKDNVVFTERPNGTDSMNSDIYFMEKGTIETKTQRTFPPETQQDTLLDEMLR